MRTREIARRTAVAYDVLRGRPYRPDYGILVVLPLMAAVAGAMIAWYLESSYRESSYRESSTDADPAVRRPEPVSL